MAAIQNSFLPDNMLVCLNLHSLEVQLRTGHTLQRFEFYLYICLDRHFKIQENIIRDTPKMLNIDFLYFNITIFFHQLFSLIKSILFPIS